MPDKLTPLLGLAGTIVSSGANMIMQGIANRKNEELAEKQYLRQKADIAAMNAYNSPASQVVRLRAAGLSPAMFYNGSSAVAGSQSSVPTYDRPDVRSPHFDAGTVLSAFNDLSKLQLDKENSKHNNALTDAKVQELVQKMAFDSENNPLLLSKARQELEDAQLNHKKLEEEYKQAVNGTILSELNIEKMKTENAVATFNFMKAITLFPRELRVMDTADAIAWIKVHQDDERLKLAFATLNETIRHNQELENYTWYKDAQDRTEHNTDRVVHHQEWFNTLNTNIKMFNAKQQSGFGGFLESIISSYLDWNKP